MVLAILAIAVTTARGETWRELAPGLDLGRFASAGRVADPAGDLVVLRVDPERWELRYLSGRARTADRWCLDEDLAAAINAGMYQDDGRSHVGFLQVGGEVRHGWANHYQSALVLDPVSETDPLFRLVDLDTTPLDSLRTRWRTVAQNLRLVKRPGENRWSPQDRRWCEAALGEDGEGRALLIHCRTPRSMHELIAILLALPLDLVAAQHLEGGQHAQLSVRGVDDPAAAAAPPVPNVLGVAPRP